MVIETHGSDAALDAAKLDAFLEAAMADGLVTDGTVAASAAQAAAIWRVREGVTEALNRRGAVYKYDLSIPLPAMYALVDEMRARFAGAVPGALVAGFGHVGDGNLHLNISVPRGSDSASSTSSSSDSGNSADDPVLALIEPFVYEWTAAHRGSISAEHGLGAMKAGVIGYSKPPAAVALMARLKRLLDPAGILNPYKVLPAEALAAAAAAAEHEAETTDTTAAAAKAGVA
jgi:D-2-hydroxyglutarate dehydrogenase